MPWPEPERVTRRHAHGGERIPFRVMRPPPIAPTLNPKIAVGMEGELAVATPTEANGIDHVVVLMSVKPHLASRPE